MLKGEFVIPAACIDGSQIVEAHLLLGSRPGGLEERIVGIVHLTLIEQAQTQIKVGFAVVGVGVTLGHTLDGGAEIFLALGKEAAAQQQQTVGGVGANIAGIALQDFQIVGIGQVGRVAVLLDVDAGQIQLLDGLDLLRQLGRGHRVGNLLDFLGLGGVLQHLAALGVPDGQCHAGLCRACGQRHGVCQDIHRADFGGLFIYRFAVHQHADDGILIHGGGVNRDGGLIVGNFKVQHDFGAGVLDISGGLVGHEILGEGLFLKGFQPSEVGLVVAEHTGHQLDVGAVVVGQVAVPCLTEVAAAPRPLLLAGADVMVGHVQNTRADLVVIAAHEVVIGVGTHIAGGNRDVLIAGDVHACTVVVLVVDAGCNREVADSALAVVEHRVDIRREDGLGVVVDRHSRVCPPEEGLGQVGAVVQLAFDFNVRLVGVDREADFALGAVHLVNLAALHRLAAVGVLLDLVVGGSKGSGAVVLRPVELDAAGDPRSEQTNQRGLDDLVVIDEIIAVRLIIGALDAASQLRQNHHLDIVVFQPEGGVGHILLLVEDLVHNGVRIHAAAAALIDTLLQEHRVLVGFADAIGRQHDLLLPDFGLMGFMFHKDASCSF